MGVKVRKRYDREFRDQPDKVFSRNGVRSSEEDRIRIL